MATPKTIMLITGGNSGIGYESCAAIAGASPENHVIITSRSLPRGEEALAQLKARLPHASLSLLQLDVTDLASIEAAATAVQRDFGRLDVLVNNAGISLDEGPYQDVLRKTLETNTIGPALVTNAFLPLIKRSPAPKIIYVSSSLGSITERLDRSLSTWRYQTQAYRMSKAAINMAMACDVAELEDVGGKVWTMCPGYLATKLTSEEDRKARIGMGLPGPEVGAGIILDIFEGRRDKDVGKFVWKNGVYGW